MKGIKVFLPTVPTISVNDGQSTCVDGRDTFSLRLYPASRQSGRCERGEVTLVPCLQMCRSLQQRDQSSIRPERQCPRSRDKTLQFKLPPSSSSLLRPSLHLSALRKSRSDVDFSQLNAREQAPIMEISKRGRFGFSDQHSCCLVSHAWRTDC